MKRKTSTAAIDIAYIILQIALIIAFIPKKMYMSMAISGAVLIIYLLFIVYEHKKGMAVTNSIRLAVIFSVFGHSFLGEYLRMYNTSNYFDKLLHIIGTFSFTAFIFLITEKEGFFIKLSRFMVLMFVLFLGSFLGTVFEIGEFIIDVIFKTLNQNGVADNNIDMICNITGAFMAGIYAIYPKKRPVVSNKNGSTRH
ncbi:MAG: hypothetical protein N3B21_13885 [Clostridia bacterium]|nr:hypothetical protein [Clostridia bacterium]